jgi:hypothetical protein
MEKTLTGFGHVLHGNKTLAPKVRYEVRIRMSPDGLLPDYDLRLLDGFPGTAILQQQSKLTLVMEDGRKLDFFLATLNSYQVTGGIY